MTNEEQTKALAELDGWTKIEESSRWETWDEPPAVRMMVRNATNSKELPSYLTSYDAIIPLIQKQDMATKSLISVHIGLKHDWCAWLSKTPSQLCESLLKAIGKWKE